jgi:DNA-binding transcriptional regulator/RsmH inhibitor MraZ
MRKELGEAFYMMSSLPSARCIVCRKLEELDAEIMMLKDEGHKKSAERLALKATEVKQDAQGRVTIPAKLRKDFPVAAKMTIQGAVTAIKLWIPEDFDEYEASVLTEETLDDIDDTIDQIMRERAQRK